MKQVFYIFTAITLGLSSANAQLSTSAMASSLLTKPVVLADVSFKANFVNNAAAISWQATMQTKVLRYELEKSMDGENFTYVTSFAGNQKQYSSTDNNLFAGTTYYRLKIVDEKNNALFSAAAFIDTKASANEIRILPTQVDEKLFVWVPSNTSIGCAAISGADGKMQRKAVINSSNNIAAIEIKGLPAGMYTLGLQTSKGETIKLKFSKTL
ncbi:MAG: hypothetical protein V4685_00950 [Bacteroidota bacterium]